MIAHNKLFFIGNKFSYSLNLFLKNNIYIYFFKFSIFTNNLIF